MNTQRRHFSVPEKRKLTGAWVPHDTCDQIVDFVRSWSEKCDIEPEYSSCDRSGQREPIRWQVINRQASLSGSS